VAIAQIAVRFAALNGTLRKNRKSIRGSARLGSYLSRAASASMDSRKKATIFGDCQP